MDEGDHGESYSGEQESYVTAEPDTYGTAGAGLPDRRTGEGKDTSGSAYSGDKTVEKPGYGSGYDEYDTGGFGSGKELPSGKPSGGASVIPGPKPSGRGVIPSGRGVIPKGGGTKGSKGTELIVSGEDKTSLETDSDPEPEIETEETLPGPALPSVRRGGITGTVRGYAELKPESIPGGLTRWFTSMFTGVPFCRDRMGFRFMLKPDAWSDKGSRQVIMYGLVQEGFLYDGSKVVVHGRTSGSGSIRANRIDLITDDDALPTRVTIMHQMPALLVWLCTLALIALAYCAVQVGIVIFNGIMQNIVTIIVILVIVIWLLSRLRRRRRRRWWWF